MTAKKKPASAPPEKRADMTVERQKSESDGKAIARLAGSATFRAAVTERQIIGTTMDGSELHLGELTSALDERFLEVTRGGNMEKAEAMLLAQAHTCEAIFHEFTRRAFRSDSMPKLESYMKMALRAQQQSASTLRVLAEMRNPRQAATFVKQANIANGPQQVNNGVSNAIPRAHEEKPIESNELLANDNGTQTLDSRATGGAVRENQELATVGGEHRAS